MLVLVTLDGLQNMAAQNYDIIIEDVVFKMQSNSLLGDLVKGWCYRTGTNPNHTTLKIDNTGEIFSVNDIRMIDNTLAFGDKVSMV